MASQPLTDAELIALLGGVSAVADGLGYDKANVKKWPKRGIPWKDRAKVAKLAAKHRKRIPADFAEERRVA